jgi:hypothetical protein
MQPELINMWNTLALGGSLILPEHRFVLKAIAISNMEVKSVTIEVSHVDRSLENKEAPENINSNCVTWDTSHFDRSLSNELAA